MHQDLVAARARSQRGRKVLREQQRFDTTTKGLLAPLAWRAARECTHVALEATGAHVAERLARRVRQLGHEVTIEQAA